MLIPEHKIEEILERVDLVALIGRHVELKKAGRSFKGRCPFHNEKTPSFQVTPEMRRFKCFGCGAGGDAISFVQRYLGKSFVDAVRDLAREAGVDLQGAEDPLAQERQQLREVNQLAAEHFKERLWDPAGGKKAREYLASRGLPDEVIRAFGLGWAPLLWTDLADVLTKAGVLEWAVQAGLVQKRNRGDGYFDTFRGRLIIPIRSPEGRTIGFGGRLLEGEDGPKYLNSKDSKLYNKSEVLFGMDQAREEVRRQKSAILVEGYFDCIGLHQVGVRHAVALCSTALTPGHLALLARSEAKELVLLLDGDDAGRKAVERLAGALLGGGTPTRVGLLPDGEDPDTFARKAGPEGVKALLSQARPLTEHLFTQVLPKGKDSGFEDKMAAVERLKTVAAALPVGLSRSAFFGALAAHTGLPAAELEAALRGKVAPPRPVPKPAGAPLPAPREAPPAAPERPPGLLESSLVAAVLRNPRLMTRDTYRATDELSHTGLRSLIARASTGTSAEDALAAASDAVRASIQRAMRELPAEAADLEVAFTQLCRKVKLRRIDEQLTHLAQSTRLNLAASDLDDDTKRLLSERGELLALRKRVLEESSDPAAGTKRSGEPV